VMRPTRRAAGEPGAQGGPWAPPASNALPEKVLKGALLPRHLRCGASIDGSLLQTPSPSRRACLKMTVAVMSRLLPNLSPC